MCEAQPHSAQVAEPGEEGPDARPHLPRSLGAGVRKGTLEEAGGASGGEIGVAGGMARGRRPRGGRHGPCHQKVRGQGS